MCLKSSTLSMSRSHRDARLSKQHKKYYSWRQHYNEQGENKENSISLFFSFIYRSVSLHSFPSGTKPQRDALQTIGQGDRKRGHYLSESVFEADVCVCNPHINETLIGSIRKLLENTACCVIVSDPHTHACTHTHNSLTRRVGLKPGVDFPQIVWAQPRSISRMGQTQNLWQNRCF